jgi:hypothetical protein
MLKTITLTLALAGIFAASGSLTADAKMRSGRMGLTRVAGAFASDRCQDLKDMAARQDKRGDNYYTNQYIQCLNR